MKRNMEPSTHLSHWKICINTSKCYVSSKILFPPWPLVWVLRNSFPQSLQVVCFPVLSVWTVFQAFERYLLSLQKPLWFDQVVTLWLFIFSKSLVFLISSHMYSGFLDSFQALSELLTFKILPPRYFSYPNVYILSMLYFKFRKTT